MPNRAMGDRALQLIERLVEEWEADETLAGGFEPKLIQECTNLINTVRMERGGQPG